MKAPVPTLGVELAPDLVHAFHKDGPFLSCFVRLDHGAEAAMPRLEVRWKELRRAMAAAGAPPGALGLVEDVLHDQHGQVFAVAVIATADEVLVVERTNEHVGRDAGCTGELPCVAPVLRWREQRPSYLVVVCDRAGADLRVVDSYGHEATTIAGEKDPHDPSLHKAKVGGASKTRYPPHIGRQTEEVWRRNAGDVAGAVDHLVEATGARLVLIGGDARACELVEADLSKASRSRAVRIPGGRHADGSNPYATKELRHQVASVVACDRAAALERLRERRSRHLAVDDVEATLAALATSQVETLLVHDSFDDERRGYFSRSPFLLGGEPGSVTELGGVARGARVADVAIFGAAMTGARVQTVPAAMPMSGGVAALLRSPAGVVLGAAG